MRAALLGLLLASACSPDIVSGAYLCGPDSTCPEDQVCNGTDNICVLPGSAEPFSCGDKQTEVEPNNAPASAQAVTNLGCISALTQIKGCSPDGDPDDYFAFDVPGNCTSVVASIRLEFPTAFEQLSVDLGGTSGTAPACTAGAPDDGTEAICISQAVTPGMHYTVHVARSGVGNCGGSCSHNRYTLSLQLGTP
jgi:hypothetical protein